MKVRRTVWQRVGIALMGLAALAPPGGPPGARLYAAAPPAQAPAELDGLSMEEIRRRLKVLDDEQSAALAAEEYDRATRLLRESDRLLGELERRARQAPVPRPPDAPDPRR
jgi:hypothetical protein